MTEPRIYMRHARQAARRPGGVTCAGGIRAWCAHNRISLTAFRTEGVAGELALQIGDAFALAALEVARREAQSRGR